MVGLSGREESLDIEIALEKDFPRFLVVLGKTESFGGGSVIRGVEVMNEHRPSDRVVIRGVVHLVMNLPIRDNPGVNGGHVGPGKVEGGGIVASGESKLAQLIDQDEAVRSHTFPMLLRTRGRSRCRSFAAAFLEVCSSEGNFGSDVVSEPRDQCREQGWPQGQLERAKPSCVWKGWGEVGNFGGSSSKSHDCIIDAQK